MSFNHYSIRNLVQKLNMCLKIKKKNYSEQRNSFKAKIKEKEKKIEK